MSKKISLDEEEITNLYLKDKKSISEIATIMHCSGWMIYKVLISRNTQLRPRNTPESKRKLSETLKMKYADGKLILPSMKGKKHTEEAKIKMSQSRKGERHPLYGKTHSEKSRFKMSQSHKGKILSEEHKLKISKSGKGKRRSEETKLKISKANIGKALSEEHKLKITHSLKGRRLSEETKTKIRTRMSGESNPFYGKKHSKEALFKMSNKLVGKFQGEKNPMYGKPATHSKGLWYTRLDGLKVWMRSTWEVKRAKLLDHTGINWLYEYKAFPITYLYNGKIKQGTYCPDFFFPDTNEYEEIKGYWRGDAKAKFDAFIEQYPKIKIRVLDEVALTNMGMSLR